MAWWRAYDEAVDDPKLQNLAPELFRAWFNLMCLASRNRGKLPSLSDIAFGLRKSEKEAKRLVDALIVVRLLDVSGTEIVPHNWNKRQYKTDVSTGRVKAFRERHKKRSGETDETVSGNVPEQSQSRAETDSVPNGTGAGAPSDPVKVLFDSGVKLLTENGCKPSNARSIIGKWRSEHGDEATQAAIKAAQAEGVTEPIAWITQRFANKPRESWRERQLRADEALIEKALQ